MNATFTFLFFLLALCTAHAQVIDYEIDPSFDTGDYFQRGSVSGILPINDDRLIITGNLSSIPGYAHGWTIIEIGGELDYTNFSQSMGPPVVEKFKNNYITAGGAIFYRNEFGQGIDYFEFEFQKMLISVGL